MKNNVYLFVIALYAAAVAVFISTVPAEAVTEDGPGYGGGVGALAIGWVGEEAPTVAGLTLSGFGIPAAPNVPPGDGQPGNDPEVVQVEDAGGAALSVVGYGFRQSAETSVQVGDWGVVVKDADTTGTLRVTIPPEDAGEIRPGLSVLASGLGPSGTTRTLVGSVPPKPSGISPKVLAPAAAVTVFLTVIVGRLLYYRQRDAAGQTEPSRFGKK